MNKRRLKLAPTTLSLWKQCLRKGAFRTIGKVRLPPNAGVPEGRFGHVHVENYCRDGIEPPRDCAAERARWMTHVDPLLRSGAYANEWEVASNVYRMSDAARAAHREWASSYMGKIVGEITHLLPKPGPKVEVEKWVSFDTGGPWVYNGRFDVRVNHADRVEIIDPKFYSAASAKQYVQTSVELARDPQAIIYSAAQFAPIVDFTMLYVVKPARSGKGKVKPLPVTVRFTESELDERLDELDELSNKVLWYVENVTDPNDVPHNADQACKGTGDGCDFSHLCNAFDGVFR